MQQESSFKRPLDLFKGSRLLDSIQRYFESGDALLFSELTSSEKALLLSLLQKASGKTFLLLTSQPEEENKLYQDLLFFSEAPLFELPSWDIFPGEDWLPGSDTIGKRFETLLALSEEKNPGFVFCNLQSTLQKLLPPKILEKCFDEIQLNEALTEDAFSERLESLAYKRVSIVTEKGEYAKRGSIVDVFSLAEEEPCRVEFWDGKIESIRNFDPISQRTVKKREKFALYPQDEMERIKTKTGAVSIFSYLPKDTVVVLDPVGSLEDKWALLKGIHDKETKAFFSFEQLFDQLESRQKLFFLEEALEKYFPEASFNNSLEIFGKNFPSRYVESPFYSLEEVSGIPFSDYEVVGIAERDRERELLIEHCPAISSFLDGYLSSGFALTDIRKIILPASEITHRKRVKRERQQTPYQASPLEIFQMLPGENIVHEQHGIGRYVGVEKRKNHLGLDNEFFRVEYAERSELFIPLEQAHLLTKYIGAHEETPRLHVLGGKRWKKAKEATEKALVGYAKDLLEMYARREMKGGFSFPDEESEELQLFEEEFPYVETDDQMKAIHDVFSDMGSASCMDRLVCGDVGYGKTEVAMRAAFKAAYEGKKQTAILVPTTVLAMQHYDSFVERMKSFPVTIGVLSRFSSPKEVRETLEGVARGGIDILIGTHRIISRDIQFKDLGLIIIDEEQRFGVRAKEYLKKLKMGVDCLTLSATPIPRTLYMSLAGVRDLSMIHTPPEERVPIQTFLAEPKEALIQSAILRELARGGQVFYIHNRIESIYKVKELLQRLIPEARIAVAYGSMDAEDVDMVFHAFKKGDADILLSTSLIENGIDISNANTILIDRADRFGIAELYQLRGRVGRSNKKAYAYFLVPRIQSLTDLAKKRLQVLVEASGRGGGFKVAMRDLEIRGAGDLLGTEQSGHVSEIGFHLYCKLLKRTIDTLEGKIPPKLVETKLEVSFAASLPESYISDTPLRIELYQRLGQVIEERDVDDLWNEITDRFGKPPPEALALYHMARLRVFCQRNAITEVRQEKYSLIATLKRGKESNVRRSIFSPTKDPSVFEEKAVTTLKNLFSLN